MKECTLAHAAKAGTRSKKTMLKKDHGESEKERARIPEHGAKSKKQGVRSKKKG
jgi:hypothetical protein